MEFFIWKFLLITSINIIQVKNVHWTGWVQEQVTSSQYSLNVWEYDNANLRVSLTPTSTDNRILINGE